jgi:hypothetical protein
MRHCISLLAVYSGLALTTTILVTSQSATATENKSAVVTKISAVELEAQNPSPNQTKVVCSRNRPLSLTSEGTKVTSGIGLQNTDWSSNVIRLFCRDVRINTIVVRDYCALIRQ